MQSHAVPQMWEIMGRNARALQDETLYCCLECKSVHVSRELAPQAAGGSSGSSQGMEESWLMPAGNSMSTQDSVDYRECR